MRKTLAKTVAEAKDVVDELWAEARVVYTKSNLETLEEDITARKFNAGCFLVRADTYRTSYPHITRRELGKSYDAFIDVHCLSARFAQLSGNEGGKEEHLKRAREYQGKLKALYPAYLG